MAHGDRVPRWFNDATGEFGFSFDTAASFAIDPDDATEDKRYAWTLPEGVSFAEGIPDGTLIICELKEGDFPNEA